VLYQPKSKNFLDQIFIRLNRKDGGSEIGAVPLITAGEKRNVFVHGDSSVDSAVIPFLPDQSQFDFKFLPDELITTKEGFGELKIREGSDVFLLVSFRRLSGRKGIIP